MTTLLNVANSILLLAYSTYAVVFDVCVCVCRSYIFSSFHHLMAHSWWWKFNFETEMREEQKNCLYSCWNIVMKKNYSSSHHHHHHHHRWKRWHVCVVCTVYLHVSTSNFCNKLQNCKHNERFEQTIMKSAYDKISSRACEVRRYWNEWCAGVRVAYCAHFVSKISTALLALHVERMFSSYSYCIWRRTTIINLFHMIFALCFWWFNELQKTEDQKNNLDQYSQYLISNENFRFKIFLVDTRIVWTAFLSPSFTEFHMFCNVSSMHRKHALCKWLISSWKLTLSLTVFYVTMSH